MIKQDWYVNELGNYWRPNPVNKMVHWYVSHNKENTFGSVAGQVLKETGWYWYTYDNQNNLFTSMVGPFLSELAAQTDCEDTNRTMKSHDQK